MQDDLRRALDTLELTPGASWSEVLTRYRQSAKTWHPDRFRDSAARQSAEEKIKTINAARELLQAHYFGYGHLNNLCDCASFEEQKPPPPTPKTTASSTSKSTAGEDSKAKAKTTQKPKPPPEPFDWLNNFCKNLDIGELSHEEPGWYETLRRASDKIWGKHPGETIGDTWEKPINWSKEHKRRCLIFSLFAIMAFDRLATAIDPNAFKAQKNETTEFGRAGNANQLEPCEKDKEDEIERERRYFEEKWLERNHPKPSN